MNVLIGARMHQRSMMGVVVLALLYVLCVCVWQASWSNDVMFPPGSM